MKLEMERLRQHCEDQTAELQRANRRNVSVVPYRERKLRKFGGSEEFEQWEAGAQASIMGGGLTDDEMVEFLCSKLEGDARREIACRGGGASNLTVNGLFAALSEVFSKRGVVPRLLSKFWARDQEVGETLVAYSHSLMGILEEIAKADPGEVPDQSVLLLKKFCAGVADQNLRWELKQQLRSVPGSTFLDLRATALRWAEECTPCEAVAAKSAVVDATGAALLQQMQDGFARLSEQLTKQQDTIDQYTAAIKELGEAGKGKRSDSQNATPNCYYCKKPGHFQRVCQQRLRDTATMGPSTPFHEHPQQ